MYLSIILDFLFNLVSQESALHDEIFSTRTEENERLKWFVENFDETDATGEEIVNAAEKAPIQPKT